MAAPQRANGAQGAVDHLVDTYVTPEGLPKLFTSWTNLSPLLTEASPMAQTQPSLPERIRQGWARVQRAEFTGLTTFEIDMADKHDPTRLYLGKLKLTPLGWKLDGATDQVPDRSGHADTKAHAIVLLSSGRAWPKAG